MNATRWCFPVALAILVTMLSGMLPAAEPDASAEKVIAELQQKAKAVKSGRADMKVTIAAIGQALNGEGTLLFRQPNMSRMELTMALGEMTMKQITLSDGKTAWDYRVTLNEAGKVDLTKVAAATSPQAAEQVSKGENITQPFKIFQPDTVKLLRTEGAEKNKTYVFEGVPSMPQTLGLPFKLAKVDVTVGADDGLLHKMVMFDESGKEVMTQSFNDIKLNVDVPDSQFQLTPPEGVRVVDVTESTIEMIKSAEQKPAQP